MNGAGLIGFLLITAGLVRLWRAERNDTMAKNGNGKDAGYTLGGKSGRTPGASDGWHPQRENVNDDQPEPPDRGPSEGWHISGRNR